LFLTRPNAAQRSIFLKVREFCGMIAGLKPSCESILPVFFQIQGGQALPAELGKQSSSAVVVTQVDRYNAEV